VTLIQRCSGMPILSTRTATSYLFLDHYTVSLSMTPFFSIPYLPTEKVRTVVAGISGLSKVHAVDESVYD
jgi:hypothetical protein